MIRMSDTFCPSGTMGFADLRFEAWCSMSNHRTTQFDEEPGFGSPRSASPVPRTCLFSIFIRDL
jgi:hypothetical protein